MQSSRRGTDRTYTRMFSRSSRPTPRTKHRRFLRVEPLEQRLVLSTYWVSPSGNNSNPGTQAKPWQTLQANVATLLPGDTMDVESGTYAGFIVGWDAAGQSQYGAIAGTAGNPITIQADPNATPGSVIINSRNNKTRVGIDLEPGCDYITIKGITVDGSSGLITSTINNGYGIKITGNYDQLIGNTVQNMIGACIAGIHDNGGNNAVIQGNTITGVQSGGDGNKGHGIYVADATGVQVIGNSIHDNAYIGIHINGDPNTVSNALIADNVIYNNGQNGINADGLQNSTIVNNLIYNYANYGICLYYGDSSGPSLNNIIVNNTIYSGTSTGTVGSIRILDASTGNTILNNILLDGSSIVYRIAADSTGGMVSNYNVVPSGAQVQSEDTGQNEPFSQWQSTTGQDKKSFSASAAQLFVNPSGNDYQELSSSPSIGSGTSTDAPVNDILGNSRPSTYGWDIGCYEYEGTTSITPTVTSESPAGNAANVAVSTAPTATFNEAVQSSTISFTLKNSSGTTVSGSATYNSTTNVATFTPASALAYNTTYTATISGAKSTSGVAMSAPFSWSFTTDAAPPSVTSETPAAGATNVAVSTAPTATFNETVQSSTISFTLKNSSGTTVSGSATYNSTTNVATFTPASALAYNTTYTATISGAKDSVGDPMSSAVSWSFTTAPAAPAFSTISIWPSTAKPTTVTDSDTGSVEIGVKFYSDVSGFITGLRFYKGITNTGTHVADLWTSSGTLLATATFTSETGSGWQQVNFTSPVAITAGTTYVASYHTNVGHYADDQNYFASQYNSGSLHVPVNGGVYAYGGAGSFPTQVWNASNYWVDIVLSPGGSPSAQPALSGGPSAAPMGAALSSAPSSLAVTGIAPLPQGAVTVSSRSTSASAPTYAQGQPLLLSQLMDGVVGRTSARGQSIMVKPISRRFMSLGESGTA